MVRICGSIWTLEVTATHRVMVNRVSGYETTPAKSLRDRDEVLISDFHVERLITPPQHFRARCQVSQITFSPDGEVEAFAPPRCTLLTRGREGTVASIVVAGDDVANRVARTPRS
jgi:hypothetical protein